MKPGTQVLYVPPQARGNVNHPDVRAGFVVSTHDLDATVRLWIEAGTLQVKVGVDWLILRNTKPQAEVDECLMEGAS
jgi:hypothetical protein